jgi:hypothetical protein
MSRGILSVISVLHCYLLPRSVLLSLLSLPLACCYEFPTPNRVIISILLSNERDGKHLFVPLTALSDAFTTTPSPLGHYCSRKLTLDGIDVLVVELRNSSSIIRSHEYSAKSPVVLNYSQYHSNRVNHIPEAAELNSPYLIPVINCYKLRDCSSPRGSHVHPLCISLCGMISASADHNNHHIRLNLVYKANHSIIIPRVIEQLTIPSN